MARDGRGEVSEQAWRLEFERRLQEILKDPGYGFVGVRIADHQVTFVEFQGQSKKPNAPKKPLDSPVY